MTVAVLGGGVAGLAISRRLALAGHKVVVFESQSRLGGWISSTSQQQKIAEGNEEPAAAPAVLFEHGPHSLRPRSEGNGLRMVQLLVELGLDKQALKSRGDKRFVYHNSGLMELPGGSLMSVLRNPLTKRIPWYLAKDALSIRRRDEDEDDETITSFMTRKLGRQAKPLIVAMVGGIFAGNPDVLSVKSCFPQLVEADRRGFGSLVRGMLLAKKPAKVDDEATAQLCKASSISFPRGMSTLVDALVRECRELGVDLKLSTPATELLKRSDNTWRVNGETFSHVVSTLQPRALAAALPDDSASASKQALLDMARKIDSVNVAVVNLSYQRESIPLLPRRAFGHLVADVKTQMETGVLGVLYDSSAFPEQQKKDVVVLSVMMGGAQAKWVSKTAAADGKEEAALVELARRAVKQQLFIDTPPVHSAARLHSDCIPQYLVGHAAKRDAMLQQVRQELPGLVVVGTSVLGVGLADSIGGGLLEVERSIL